MMALYLCETKVNKNTFFQVGIVEEIAEKDMSVLRYLK
jgi:hypothetical protein